MSCETEISGARLVSLSQGTLRSETQRAVETAMDALSDDKEAYLSDSLKPADRDVLLADPTFNRFHEVVRKFAPACESSPRAPADNRAPMTRPQASGDVSYCDQGWINSQKVGLQLQLTQCLDSAIDPSNRFTYRLRKLACWAEYDWALAKLAYLLWDTCEECDARGLTWCPALNDCADLDSDNENCGACLQACTPPDTCQERSCKPPPCSVDTCREGCCDAQGHCQGGNAADACGVYGARCQDCTSNGGSCSVGACLGPDAGTCKIPQNSFSWEMSADGGATWAPVTLPDVNFGCTNCTRRYRTHVEGPACSVSFRFVSDNAARMLVNGQAVFDEYFITTPEWCTTAICCSLCCDSPTHCVDVLNQQTPFQLSDPGLAAFHSGINEIQWEVYQATGSSGFVTEMTVTR